MPVAQEEHRVGVAVDVAPVHGHLAHGATGCLGTGFVKHGHTVARVGAAHAAGLGRPGDMPAALRVDIGRAIAHHVVDLGLAEHLVDAHTELLAAPMEDGVAHRFARAHQRAQLQAVLLARLGHGFHHRLQRRGEEKTMRDAVALHQLKSDFRREAALVGHDLAAEVQRGQERV